MWKQPPTPVHGDLCLTPTIPRSSLDMILRNPSNIPRPHTFCWRGTSSRIINLFWVILRRVCDKKLVFGGNGYRKLVYRALLGELGSLKAWFFAKKVVLYHSLGAYRPNFGIFHQLLAKLACQWCMYVLRPSDSLTFVRDSRILPKTRDFQRV